MGKRWRLGMRWRLSYKDGNLLFGHRVQERSLRDVCQLLRVYLTAELNEIIINNEFIIIMYSTYIST